MHDDPVSLIFSSCFTQSRPTHSLLSRIRQGRGRLSSRIRYCSIRECLHPWPQRDPRCLSPLFHLVCANKQREDRPHGRGTLSKKTNYSDGRSSMKERTAPIIESSNSGGNRYESTQTFLFYRTFGASRRTG
jgi:hypothetical protein